MKASSLSSARFSAMAIESAPALLRWRMALAKDALLHGGGTLDEIAAQVGSNQRALSAQPSGIGWVVRRATMRRMAVCAQSARSFAPCKLPLLVPPLVLQRDTVHPGLTVGNSVITEGCDREASLNVCLVQQIRTEQRDVDVRPQDVLPLDAGVQEAVAWPGGNNPRVGRIEYLVLPAPVG